MADRAVAASEAGFSLIEVVVCGALVVSACVLALGLMPTLVHAAAGGVLRGAALNVARTEIERIKAATAYAPPTGASPTHAYALNAAVAFTATAHVHRSLCGAPQTTTDVPLHVAVSYVAAGDSVTVTVGYPRNACDASVLDVVVLAAQLAPSALAPGTMLTTAIDDPAQQ